ncbi:phosphoenolpyruvate carboxylase [Nonlabens dokdonensis]|uniref:Phosphoenolpyruvate carboxylase n=1 Tax=Nonlabens dokdonensis TaxID=328515 RepID=A0A1Z8B129_9FLAO|nr:phosphoenolpyruvate carboxylase [Nonlabens dokdonensis]OUS16277.1 phosphoenolpyruvate carboxylase [Nonlabens dokdonensis]
MSRLTRIERFENEVKSKYQIFNGIFMTLPFDKISNTGGLLPLFHELCVRGYEKGKNPTEIVEYFFERYIRDADQKERESMLFRFIQYIERQVVLFDAIEDAAFGKVNNLDGRGSLRSVKDEAVALGKTQELTSYLKEFKVRPVLTAHPTQFYPGSVLGILNDLGEAIKANEIQQVKLLLSQLGKTPFFKKEKPTPFDEAISLIWYLENVFYFAMGNIYDYLKKHIEDPQEFKNQIVEIGFWPGGDRDGNPFVTTEITLNVAKRLRSTIFRNYYRDIRKLRRRLTFKGVEEQLSKMESQCYKAIFEKGVLDFTAQDLIDTMTSIRDTVIKEHNSLFLDQIDSFIHKIELFGFHFATLDIRQDSSAHDAVFDEILAFAKAELPDNYNDLSEVEKVNVLSNVEGNLRPDQFKEEYTQRTLSSIYAIRDIQDRNGEKGCNRYIISNTQMASQIMEVYAMIRLCGMSSPNIDVVPLFETVPDLINAPDVMRKLYENEKYRAHLSRRGDKQDIMLGFSDGTKDGGYLMANWAIYKAKEALTAVSREYGVSIVFFDGRGGPPARGGGQTHQFYASMGTKIAAKEIQLTIQGQTISSKFGTLESCQFNLEQMISSGVSNAVYASDINDFSDKDKSTMDELSEISYKAYTDFKAHPQFLSYLEKMSTLKYYAKTNIGSRPSKRAGSTELRFKDLRAIPFVGSWSQLKQNVPGFYGVGTALEAMDKSGKWEDATDLYRNNKFFRTLLDNSMMSLTKSFFGLTAYMEHDPVYGEFWKLIFEEYQRSKKYMLKISGMRTLMENELAGRASIETRENIVLPLLTIQQYALKMVQDIRSNVVTNDIVIYERMVTRSLYGNINASRNSA